MIRRGPGAHASCLAPPLSTKESGGCVLRAKTLGATTPRVPIERLLRSGDRSKPTFTGVAKFHVDCRSMLRLNIMGVAEWIGLLHQLFGRRVRLDARAKRVDWGPQTPPSNPTAVNVYARIASKGESTGIEDAQLNILGVRGNFVLLYVQNSGTGERALPRFERGDVRDLMFRFESRAPLTLDSTKGTVKVRLTNGRPIEFSFPIPLRA